MAPGNKVALELLQQILVHKSTILLMARDTNNVWKDVELRIYPNPFCTSCQIYPMNKNDTRKNPL